MGTSQTVNETTKQNKNAQPTPLYKWSLQALCWNECTLTESAEAWWSCVYHGQYRGKAELAFGRVYPEKEILYGAKILRFYFSVWDTEDMGTLPELDSIEKIWLKRARFKAEGLTEILHQQANGHMMRRESRSQKRKKENQWHSIRAASLVLSFVCFIISYLRWFGANSLSHGLFSTAFWNFPKVITTAIAMRQAAFVILSHPSPIHLALLP